MTYLLSFNDPEKSDISIHFTDGNVIHMSSETLNKSFEFFEAPSFMKASELFHDENVLVEALIRAQFGDLYQVAITHENWVAHLHLCDLLSASESHWNYILSWLPKLNIDVLDQALFDYMSKHAISRDAVINALHGTKVIDVSSRYCGYCCSIQTFTDDCCTRCGRLLSSMPSTKESYNLVPILNWVATQHHHATMDIIETRNLILSYHPHGRIFSLPSNAEKCSFML